MFKSIIAPCYFPNEVRLGGVERSAIGVQYVMEPLLGDRLALFGPPRVVGLSSAEHQPPVYCPHVVFLEHRQVCNKMGHQGSRHVLSAYHRPPVLLHSVDSIGCALLIAVCVKGYDIAL